MATKTSHMPGGGTCTTKAEYWGLYKITRTVTWELIVDSVLRQAIHDYSAATANGAAAVATASGLWGLHSFYLPYSSVPAGLTSAFGGSVSGLATLNHFYGLRFRHSVLNDFINDSM